MTIIKLGTAAHCGTKIGDYTCETKKLSEEWVHWQSLAFHLFNLKGPHNVVWIGEQDGVEDDYKEDNEKFLYLVPSSLKHDEYIEKMKDNNYEIFMWSDDETNSWRIVNSLMIQFRDFKLNLVNELKDKIEGYHFVIPVLKEE